MAAMKCVQGHGLVKVSRANPKSRRPQRRLFSLTCLAAGAFTLSAHGGGMPPCLPPVVGAALVKDVKEQGVLSLNDRRTAKLEGLVWPAPDRYDPQDPGSARSTAALVNLATGHRIVIRIRAPRL